MRTDTPVAVKLSDYAPYPFQIDQVTLSFMLDPVDNPGRTIVTTHMSVTPLGNGPMVLDGVQLELLDLRIADEAHDPLADPLSLTGRKLDASEYTLTDESLTLQNPPPRPFVLITQVGIKPAENTALSGLYMSAGRYCTQCESVGFRRITFYPDRPDVMSRFRVWMAGDKAKYPVLLSNGTPGPRGDLGANKHFATWDDPHKKPAYLFALCAGDYDVYKSSFTTMNGHEVDLGVYVDKGDAGRAAWAMDSLKRSMTWDEEVFGREYDLGVFNIVAVRDFNFGAMENKGLNIFNSAYVLADEATATDADFEAIESIVGHEYFHNWTGNRITCRDWFQLCLKEGLTVFRDQEFSADMRSRPVQRIKDVIRLRARQFPEDAGPLAHQVRPDSYGSIDNLYTATVYEKGAEIIRMLKTMIGAENFAKGMQIYFDKHDGDAATIEDFYACFETATGRDLTDFKRWYSQPGTPLLTAVEAWDAAAGRLTLTVTQTNPPTPGRTGQSPLPMPLSLAAFAADGTKLAAETITMTGQAVWIVDAKQRPLISLNRGFAAPVRVDHQVSDDTKLKLATVDDDPFNQFDILQALLKQDFLALAYQGAVAPNQALIAAVADAVTIASGADPAFAALLARIPDTGEMFLEREPVDPSALGEARKVIKAALATALAPLADKVLSQASPTPFDPGAVQAGTRALRSAMIDLLGASGRKDAPKRLKSIFDTAPNMTESLSALRALSQTDSPQRNDAIAAFHAKWRDNPNVIDKWFATQALYGNAETAAALVNHPDFTLSTPNRVRSVAATFAMSNLPGFHAPDGSGYRFLAGLVIQADKSNPALAARLLTAFEQWKKLEPTARASAEAVLRDLATQPLSENAADIVARALA